ncbi:uncharacterized protein LOC141619770 [Silene latifolia]|uniref:uncharacterized protein LOC141619770 n=1 Tax=Silene latifolia TaxID=37657 RepID=UPI003D7893EC
MVVKSEKATDLMRHLTETFSTLREYKMKLNQSKCTFGVSSGKFLGYIVNQRGVEANIEQIKVVLQMESPEKPKDVQRLAGKVSALSRFISRSSDKCRLFYDILRKSQKFEWTADHEQAFRELKHYLCNPPLLSKPEPGEPLFLCLAVTEVAVSAVLVREQEKEQRPFYYVECQNGLYTLVGNDIQYDPRTSIKSQTLADFVSDFSPAIQNLADEEVLTLEGGRKTEVWQIHIDRASNQRGAGVGLILRSPQGNLIAQAVRCEFKATNNETEYEALILGMQLALDLGVRNLHISSDSLLIVNYVNGEFIARDPKMIAYLEKADEIDRRELEDQQDELGIQTATEDEVDSQPTDQPSDQPAEVSSRGQKSVKQSSQTRWNITLKKSAPRTLKSNGQAESSNKIIMDNLRRRLQELGGKWADELPLVLWLDRTTPKIATGQTPFTLVFGVEVVIPSEVLVPTHRYGCMTGELNNTEMVRSLDTVDELRASAKIRLAAYK